MKISLLVNLPASVTLLLRPMALAAVVAVASFTPQAHAQLLQYTFNDTGTTTANTGSAAGASLTFENSAGTATDLHSAAGSGVSGTASDLAFANQATAQGSAGTGGAAFNTGVTAFNGLGTLTLTGWYNAASAPFGTSARLLINSAQTMTLNFNSANLAFTLPTTASTTTSVTTTNATANAAGSWVFFAVTYDGATLRLYLGTPTASAASVSSTALTGTTSVSNGLYIGNVAALNRPFNGSIDDVRLYNTALTTAQVQAVQAGDLTNVSASVPEPSAWAAAGVGAGLLGLLLRRRALRS